MVQSDFHHELKCTCLTIAYSSVSNILGLLTSHPLDTVKVRMQVQTNATVLNTMTTTLRGEGVSKEQFVNNQCPLVPRFLQGYRSTYLWLDAMQHDVSVLNRNSL